VSVGHWGPTVGLPTVVEHPSSARGTAAIRSNNSGSTSLPLPPFSTGGHQLTTTMSPAVRSNVVPVDRSHQHNRSISTASAVSSVGPSTEYEEEELDAEWLRLINEVNSLLTSKNKEPIRTARCDREHIVMLLL
jgi:hypothetical protein